MSLWCVLFDPRNTIHQSNTSFLLRKVLKQHPHTLCHSLQVTPMQSSWLLLYFHQKCLSGSPNATPEKKSDKTNKQEREGNKTIFKIKIFEKKRKRKRKLKNHLKTFDMNIVIQSKNPERRVPWQILNVICLHWSLWLTLLLTHMHSTDSKIVIELACYNMQISSPHK